MKGFIAISLLLAALTGLAGSGGYTLSGARHTVKPGQTLWEIACAYMEKQDRIRDVRELVWEIRQKNGLADCMLQPGQVLEIPLWKAGKPGCSRPEILRKKHEADGRKKNAETERTD